MIIWPESRAVIDIGYIDVSIKMSCDIDILELGVAPVKKSCGACQFDNKHIYHSEQGSRNFELKIGLDSQVTPRPAPTPLKKTTKNVVTKTNDIVIYALRCITTFSELSKVFFHFILMKKPR